MSVRAYRVKKIDYEDDPSWNLWHNDDIMEYLEDKALTGELGESGGLMYLQDEDLEALIKIVEARKITESYGEDEKKMDADVLRADLKWSQKRGYGGVQYYCF